jgi:serine/threonine-protein kinase HipA
MLHAGSSLGGARPKAHVRARDGRVAIAKFPSEQSDTWNVMAWEKTALDLGRLAGITVPDSSLVSVAGRQVLVIDRFDRQGARRIGYMSALTMLEARDGDTGSYVDIASAVEERSPSATTERVGFAS